VPTHYDDFFKPLGKEIEFVTNVDIAGLPGEVASAGSDIALAALPRLDATKQPAD
jgi:hypothetical protein